MSTDEYLELNRTNWDSRAPVHAQGYGIDELLADPESVSGVVAFDRPGSGTSPAWMSCTCSATSAPTP